ncbi:beta-propeller domain-containing protein [Haloarcula pelagica]|uniref:beta-propeller domain-containing protein n=1 Tax=Haloarcula pelagica TaxID=3033389 RepID=UPI0024C24334|nr:beta-propeller domain-containing protein [Halomicroarcula sp. YJ-61-S]
MRTQYTAALFVALLVVSLVAAGTGFAVVPPGGDAPSSQNATGPAAPTPADGSETGATGAVAQFGSEAAFDGYVSQGLLRTEQRQPRSRLVFDNTLELTTDTPQAANFAAGDGGGSTTTAEAPSRVGTTNVQIAGIDEPDRLKTDGRNFYYAPSRPRGHVPVFRPRGRPADVSPPAASDHDTHVVDVTEPAAPSAIGEIDDSGKLLQTGDTLVVVGHRTITGYDVSDPESPEQAWEHPLNHTAVTARMQNGTVYLVTRSGVSLDTPCPITPLGGDHTIPCGDVYRPGTQIPVDATYTALSIDAAGGTVEDSVTFVGTSRNTVVHMSPDALYVTYTDSTSHARQLGAFLRTEFDETPAHVEERIAEIQSYDISARATNREIDRVFEQWLATLPTEERKRLREAFTREFADYRAARQRNATTTGIVRLAVDGTALSVEATGTVPGRPLNQFSMDHHEGTLRITTTIPAVGSADSANDLYVLDSRTLDERGAVTDMGVTERVYSVRYVDETAYVVTFRRIDPFHVVDLSDPDEPEVTGELKLPGFSSYLHPIDDDHVLGIGKEDGAVKTVLFDVSDPSDPSIDDQRVRHTRHWSAISRSHHAFTIDRKHGVFVLPTGEDAIVVNYTDGSLSETATVRTDGTVTRTRYVEDYLYVFSGEEVVVVDERTWDRETTLALEN